MSLGTWSPDEEKREATDVRSPEFVVGNDDDEFEELKKVAVGLAPTV